MSYSIIKRALVGISTTALAGTMVVIPSFTGNAPEADAAPNCPAVEFIEVEGTGASTPKRDPNIPGLVGDAIKKRGGADESLIRTWTTPYPATAGVLYQLGMKFSQFNVQSSVTYGQSRLEGYKRAISHMEEVAYQCPTTKFALTGYSQGAQVAGDVAEAVSQGVVRGVGPERMVGTVLYGDPGRSGNSNFDSFDGQTSVLYAPMPSGSKLQRGLEVVRSDDNVSIYQNSIGLVGARPHGFAGQQGKVISFCDQNDPACSVPPNSMMRAIADSGNYDVDSLSHLRAAADAMPRITKFMEIMIARQGDIARELHAAGKAAQATSIQGNVGSVAAAGASMPHFAAGNWLLGFGVLFQTWAGAGGMAAMESAGETGLHSKAAIDIIDGAIKESELKQGDITQAFIPAIREVERALQGFSYRYSQESVDSCNTIGANAAALLSSLLQNSPFPWIGELLNKILGIDPERLDRTTMGQIAKAVSMGTSHGRYIPWAKSYNIPDPMIVEGKKVNDWTADYFIQAAKNARAGVTIPNPLDKGSKTKHSMSDEKSIEEEYSISKLAAEENGTININEDCEKFMSFPEKVLNNLGSSGKTLNEGSSAIGSSGGENGNVGSIGAGPGGGSSESNGGSVGGAIGSIGSIGNGGSSSKDDKQNEEPWCEDLEKEKSESKENRTARVAKDPKDETTSTTPTASMKLGSAPGSSPEPERGGVAIGSTHGTVDGKSCKYGKPKPIASGSSNGSSNGTASGVAMGSSSGNEGSSSDKTNEGSIGNGGSSGRTNAGSLGGGIFGNLFLEGKEDTSKASFLAKRTDIYQDSLMFVISNNEKVKETWKNEKPMYPMIAMIKGVVANEGTSKLSSQEYKEILSQKADDDEYTKRMASYYKMDQKNVKRALKLASDAIDPSTAERQYKMKDLEYTGPISDNPTGNKVEKEKPTTKPSKPTSTKKTPTSKKPKPTSDKETPESKEPKPTSKVSPTSSEPTTHKEEPKDDETKTPISSPQEPKPDTNSGKEETKGENTGTTNEEKDTGTNDETESTITPIVSPSEPSEDGNMKENNDKVEPSDVVDKPEEYIPTGSETATPKTTENVSKPSTTSTNSESINAGSVSGGGLLGVFKSIFNNVPKKDHGESLMMGSSEIKRNPSIRVTNTQSIENGIKMTTFIKNGMNIFNTVADQIGNIFFKASNGANMLLRILRLNSGEVMIVASDTNGADDASNLTIVQKVTVKDGKIMSVVDGEGKETNIDPMIKVMLDNDPSLIADAQPLNEAVAPNTGNHHESQGVNTVSKDSVNSDENDRITKEIRDSIESNDSLNKISKSQNSLKSGSNTENTRSSSLVRSGMPIYSLFAIMIITILTLAGAVFRRREI